MLAPLNVVLSGGLEVFSKQEVDLDMDTQGKAAASTNTSKSLNTGLHRVSKAQS
jgi:hypothetical protein